MEVLRQTDDEPMSGAFPRGSADDSFLPPASPSLGKAGSEDSFRGVVATMLAHSISNSTDGATDRQDDGESDAPPTQGPRLSRASTSTSSATSRATSYDRQTATTVATAAPTLASRRGTFARQKSSSVLSNASVQSNESFARVINNVMESPHFDAWADDDAPPQGPILSEIHVPSEELVPAVARRLERRGNAEATHAHQEYLSRRENAYFGNSMDLALPLPPKEAVSASARGGVEARRHAWGATRENSLWDPSLEFKPGRLPTIESRSFDDDDDDDDERIHKAKPQSLGDDGLEPAPVLVIRGPVVNKPPPRATQSAGPTPTGTHPGCAQDSEATPASSASAPIYPAAPSSPAAPGSPPSLKRARETRGGSQVPSVADSGPPSSESHKRHRRNDSGFAPGVPPAAPAVAPSFSYPFGGGATFGAAGFQPMQAMAAMPPSGAQGDATVPGTMALPYVIGPNNQLFRLMPTEMHVEPGMRAIPGPIRGPISDPIRGPIPGPMPEHMPVPILDLDATMQRLPGAHGAIGSSASVAVQPRGAAGSSRRRDTARHGPAVAGGAEDEDDSEEVNYFQRSVEDKIKYLYGDLKSRLMTEFGMPPSGKNNKQKDAELLAYHERIKQEDDRLELRRFDDKLTEMLRARYERHATRQESQRGAAAKRKKGANGRFVKAPDGKDGA